MKAHAAHLLLTVFAFTLCYSDVCAQDGTKVYLNGMKSCVMVLNVERQSQGSGSVINMRDGYILTNWHVVREGAKMLVIFPMWEKDRPIVESDKYISQARKLGLVGEVIAADQKVDLAIIKLQKPADIPKLTQSVRFAVESPLAGSKIYSIGNPGASDAMWIYTPGEVRAVYKKQWSSGGSNGKKLGDHDAKIIEATSATNAGDSGGPCFNEKGEQIGVTQGGLRANVAQAFSYFIDSSEVKNFLKAKKIVFDCASDDGTEPKVDSKEPDPKTEAKVDPLKKELPKADPAAEELAKQEKAAASMLNLMRPLAKDPSRKAFVVGKLKDLIKMYPKTEAAKEARQILEKIP